MSKLRVDIDYEKAVQFIKTARHFLDKLEMLFDEAALHSRKEGNEEANKEEDENSSKRAFTV